MHPCLFGSVLLVSFCGIPFKSEDIRSCSGKIVISVDEPPSQSKEYKITFAWTSSDQWSARISGGASKSVKFYDGHLFVLDHDALPGRQLKIFEQPTEWQLFHVFEQLVAHPVRLESCKAYGTQMHRLSDESSSIEKKVGETSSRIIANKTRAGGVTKETVKDVASRIVLCEKLVYWEKLPFLHASRVIVKNREKGFEVRAELSKLSLDSSGLPQSTMDIPLTEMVVYYRKDGSVRYDQSYGMITSRIRSNRYLGIASQFPRKASSAFSEKY